MHIYLSTRPVLELIVVLDGTPLYWTTKIMSSTHNSLPRHKRHGKK